MGLEGDILAANLERLRQTEPALAERLAAAEPAPMQWQASRRGPLTASVVHDGRPLQLASRYDPEAEADKLIAHIDAKKHAGYVVLGVGLGYHVAKVVAAAGRNSLVIVFEPDIAVLRAVLERIDHTAWLGQTNVILADDRFERGELIRRVESRLATLTIGTVLVTHPPTRQRCGESLAAFGEMVTEAIAYCRTQVATALVNATRTVRNFSFNLGDYAAGADTNDLHQYAKDCPAVCVGAGPSLARNIDLLRDPAVRRNYVLISAQTTLKPLLDRGIRPDFVTALDYHEISKRFYEDLPALPDVTLVVEPLVHYSIVEGYPGPVRMTQSPFLDALLGDQARRRVHVPYGSTVAHLSLYVAQHLGCDPIILIGQDLGFSDGLYYCPGTAIHNVWASELNGFNTLEMLEWQRIVRHRNNLRRLTDIHDQPIYSDEQMTTYLKQFERDFLAAPQTVIDATEGGLPKDNTTRMTLAAALAEYATAPAPRAPLPPSELNAESLAAAKRMCSQRIDEVRQLRRVSQQTIPLLRQMLACQGDRQRQSKLYEKINKNRQTAMEKLSVVFGLVNDLNTIGAFRRARADRAIHHTEGDDREVQGLQLQRDITNVEWLVQACDELLETLTAANDRLARRCGAAVTCQPAAA